MFKGLGDTAKEAGAEADEAIENLKSSLASLAAGVSLSMFAKKMAEVRGEVQQLEVAFETMLGSKERADQLIAEVTELAAKTPFGLEDVSSATKMLLAFGSTAEEVAGEITMLGDIASGLSIPLNDMIFLYGSTRTQGQMFTQDLRQFMSRGIPLADELAKIFGVTKAEVGELVSKGEVGFEQMAQALRNMTSEGGQFAGLMEKQSQTIAGQMSAIEDAIYQMFNELGEKNEGLISSVLSGTSWAIENYEKLLKVIVPVIAAYGAYKATLIATAAIQKASTIIASTKAFFELAKSVKSAKDAMLLLNMATNANPLAILLSILTTIGVAVWQFSKGTEDAAQQMGEMEKAAHDEYIEVNRLVGRLRDANLEEDERVNIINQLKTINPSLIEGLDNEATALDTLTKNLKAYNEAQIKRIQLGALQDQHGEKLTGLANAELKYTQAKAEMDAAISKLVADYQRTGKLPEIDTTWYSVYNEKEVRENLKEVLDEAIAGTLSGDKLASRLYLATTPGGVDNSKNVTIKGFDIGRMTKQVSDYKKAVDKAQKEVASSAQNMQEVMKRLRLTPETDKSPENNSTAEELTEAEKKAAEERAKELAEAEKKAAEERAKELAEFKIKLREDAEQAEIDAMADGTDKKIAQAELDWKRQRDAIQKMEKELINKQGKPLTDDQKKQFSLLHQVNAIDYSNKVNDILNGEDADFTEVFAQMEAEWLAMDEYLIKFGTLQEKIRATKRKYERDIAEALTEGERKTLEAERDALIAEYEEQASDWAKELTDKTVVELNKMLAELEAEVKAKNEAFQALDSVDEATRQDYLDTINKLNAQIAILKTKLGEANKAVSDSNWAEATQVFQSIASSASEAANGIAGLDENLAYMLSSLADLAGVATNITASIQALDKAIKAVEKASAVLAIIGAAVQAISYIANIFKENTEATQRATDALRAYNAELERINNANISNAYSNIFGKDEYGELNARLNAVREYQTEIDKIYAETDRKWEQNPFLPDDVTLSADMRSGWQKFWGTGDENIKKTSLNEFFNNGVLDVEKLKAYYNAYGEYLDEGEKELVEKLISNGELLQENIDAVTNYLQDKFGSLGGTISDALIDAFKNGTDAAEAMGNAFTDIMEQIAKDMAYSSFIQPLLDEANVKIAKLNEQRKGMSDEEYFEQLMSIGTALMGDAANAQEGYNEFMENLRWYAEQNGMDLFGAGGTSKDTGIARASQESVDELNGRATAIQSHTYSIMQSQQQLVQDTAQVLQYLSHIDENTRGLKVMQQDMASMRKDINTIVTQGISMR